MNKTTIMLTLIILIALTIRISGALLFPAFSGGDEWMHYEIVLHNQDKDYSGKITQYYSKQLLNDYYSHTPIYYSFMGIFKDFYFIRIIQSLISSISILIVFMLIKLKWNPNTALYCASFIAFLPTHVIQSATINPDILCSLFALLMFYFLFKEIKKHQEHNLIVSITFFTLAFITKLIALWLIIPLITIIIYSSYKHDKDTATYLIFPFLAGIYFFTFNLKYLSWYGTNLNAGNIENISIINFIRVFTGFFLQEYGTAIIPNIRYLFFLFFLMCAITLIYYSMKKTIKFTALNSTIMLSIITVITGTFYIAIFYVYPQGRYLFTILPFIPLIYYNIVTSKFWKNALIYSLILFTILLFSTIHYNIPICTPYPTPICEIS